MTVLEANGEIDGGDVWASRTFRTREAGKSSLYRHEVRRAAIEAVVEAVTAVADGGRPEPLDYGDPRVVGRPRPLMRQRDRAIDWSADSTATVLRRIRAAEGHPGVLDTIAGKRVPPLRRPSRGRAARRARRDRRAAPRRDLPRDRRRCGLDLAPQAPGAFKLPATRALGSPARADVPELPARCTRPAAAARSARSPTRSTRGVGYLHFDFYNGAMSTDQCRRLLDAYRYARGADTRVIVLMGGADFFSNGIHLNVIEAADDPAAESWSTCSRSTTSCAR